MGCDIHMFVEYRVNGGKWMQHPGHKIEIEEEGTDDEYTTYGEVFATGRNYVLFGALAGVRYDGPDALGLPDDCSEFVQKASDNWGEDGHSHSYLSLDDFEKVIMSFEYHVPTDRVDMFYNLREGGWDNCPPDYTTIIAGCRRHAMELVVDDILLTENTEKNVEHRVVFWFDN